MEHIIYDNYDIYNNEAFEEEKRFRIEECEITEEECTDDFIYNVLADNNQMFFDDERAMLKRVQSGSDIIAIADLGLWFGRRVGYKEFKNLEDIMYSDCDYEKVYVDSNGDLRKTETHHDGTNTILYRYWKDGVNRELFMSKCYDGTVTQKDITYFTRKAGLEIAEEYGWKVRGIKCTA